MRFTTILLGAILLFAVTTSRRAEACGGGGGGDYGGVIAAVVIVGGTYVGGTLAFGIKDIASDNHSVGYGVGETLFNAPFAVMWGAALVDDMRDPYSDHQMGKTAAVFAGIHTALLAHGIYTIAKRRPRKDASPAAPQRYDGPPGAMQVGPVTAVVSPAAIADGGGIGLAGTF